MKKYLKWTNLLMSLVKNRVKIRFWVEVKVRVRIRARVRVKFWVRLGKNRFCVKEATY